MTTTTSSSSRPPTTTTPLRWLKDNLFSSWGNGILTLLSLAFLYFIFRGIITWVLFTANWTPVASSLRLFAVGQYPPDQLWRVGTILFLITCLAGVSWSVWSGTVRTYAMAIALGFLVLSILPIGLDRISLTVRLWFVGCAAWTGVGFLLGRKTRIRGSQVLGLWGLSFVVSMILLRGFSNNQVLPLVGTGLWGGLLLTFLLALVGIVASFPIGVLLALGRQSQLPILKLFCTLFIELVRGVPLVTILFMASIILPLFLPEDIRIDRVLRAMIGMTLFTAAYMAENVRGGLQAIPRGQVEAAKAVGLNGFQTMLLVVLPQALRAVIPTIVGQFIALFMDTTLAIIVGLLELLAIGFSVLSSNPAWLLLDTEVYLFIAAVFWVFTYSMYYASRRLEAVLGVGER